MRLVTYRKGSSKPRVGALVDDAVLDLGALAADLVRERGTVRRGRGGFPKTMTRQSSHTSKMIFPVDECIAVLSLGFTILPGDVIATGTPEGVGAALGKFLKAGDKMEAEVERIGVLTNKIAAP